MSRAVVVVKPHDPGLAVILNALVHARGVTAAHRCDGITCRISRRRASRWAAVKNGWYPDTDAPVWRVLCTGVIDHGRPNRWVLVVTTRYPAELGMAYGQQTCSGIAARALPPDV